VNLLNVRRLGTCSRMRLSWAGFPGSIVEVRAGAEAGADREVNGSRNPTHPHRQSSTPRVGSQPCRHFKPNHKIFITTRNAASGPSSVSWPNTSHAGDYGGIRPFKKRRVGPPLSNQAEFRVTQLETQELRLLPAVGGVLPFASRRDALHQLLKARVGGERREVRVVSHNRDVRIALLIRPL